jgi:hypothetical protein
MSWTVICCSERWCGFQRGAVMNDVPISGIVKALSQWPEVLAIAEGGSRASGNFDADSDIDLYVYVRQEIPAARRAAFVLPRSDDAELDNRIWETGDEWTDREAGIVVDVMYRSPSWIETELTKVLDDYQASLGYTTCFWYNVLTSRPLFDRDGWYATLKKKASRNYPQMLVKAIVQKNFPLLRSKHAAFSKQILKAARRRDIVSVNHRIAGFLASYFDVLFAINRKPHPGEKRLLSLAAQLAIRPEGLTEQIEQLLSYSVLCDERKLGFILDRLVDGVAPLVAPYEALGG